MGGQRLFVYIQIIRCTYIVLSTIIFPAALTAVWAVELK